MKKAVFLVIHLSMVFSSLSVYAGGDVYFKTSDGREFWCDEDDLECQLSDSSKLRGLMDFKKKQQPNISSSSTSQSAPQPQSASQAQAKHLSGEPVALDVDSDEDAEERKEASSSRPIQNRNQDGKSPETAFRVDLNGRIFIEYVRGFIEYCNQPHLVPLPFKKGDCDTVLTFNLARTWGFSRLEEHLCKILEVPTLDEILAKEKLLSDPLAALGSFIPLSGGIFSMGSPANEVGRGNDEQQRQVTLRSFEVMDAPVTQVAYAQLMHENPSKFKERKYCPETFIELEIEEKKIPMCPNHGVENVSYEDALRYKDKLNERSKDSGYEYDLPTEAQQEFYFRGGTETAYVTGADASHLGDFVVHDGNSMGPSGEKQTHPVKLKLANPFGIYRSGLWEWGKDWYQPNLGAAAVVDPIGPAQGSHRVVRGGPSWYGGAAYGRSAFRYFVSPGCRSPFLGLRLVRTSHP